MFVESLMSLVVAAFLESSSEESDSDSDEDESSESLDSDELLSSDSGNGVFAAFFKVLRSVSDSESESSESESLDELSSDELSLEDSSDDSDSSDELSETSTFLALFADACLSSSESSALRLVPVGLGGGLSGPDSSSASLSDSEEDDDDDDDDEEEEESEDGEELLLFFFGPEASSIETSESESDSDSESELDSSSSALDSDDSSLSSFCDDTDEDFHASYMLASDGAACLLVTEITFPLRSFSSLIKALLAEA